MTGITTGRGAPEPLGVRPAGDGVDVAVVSANGTAVDFCVFDDAGTEVVRHRLRARTGDVFHDHIAGISEGTRYGFRVEGLWEPRAGHRFNPAKLLIDPYARRLDRAFRLHPSLFDARNSGAREDLRDSAPHMPKSIVEAPAVVAPIVRPTIAPRDRVVYEMHVKGFTKLHPDVPEAIRGTFAGLAHPAAIEHLTRLGVTVVELMPIWAGMDERHLPPLGLTNYWNYNPIAPLAVDPRLAPGGWPEVRAAVDALHAAGMAVILDVVLNHTGESDHLGPTVSFRGLDNALYYQLRPDDPSRYIDDSGCGNIPALQSQPMLRLGLDALRHAATVGGFDGFRYDLATAMGRRRDGFETGAPFLAALRQDPCLRDLVHVAEPWDIGPGGYRLGAFPAGWGEWNDRYRDVMRRFWRGDQGLVGEVATRFVGSADVFAARRRRTSDSVNFITAHDGFTVADLVSHSRKHNEANGEANRDGSDANNSWNHGIEGASEDPTIREARARDVRALLATLLASRGTPMISMGDELGRSQGGNNNAYAQDNALSWIDWAKADRGLIDFVGRLVRLRREHPALRDDRPPTGEPVGDSGVPDVVWRTRSGREFTTTDWRDPETFRFVAVLAAEADDGSVDRVAVILSVDPRPAVFVPPPARPGMRWSLVLDSAHPDREAVPGSQFPVDGRSVTFFAEEPVPTEVRSRPIDGASLDRLARAAGIAPEWWDLSGVGHKVGDDTKRAVLASMGFPAETVGEAEDGLARLIEETTLRPLPLSHTIFTGRAPEVPLSGPRARSGASFAMTVECETGERRRFVVHPGDGRTDRLTTADGRALTRRWVAVPDLPLGRHRLSMDGTDVVCRLTVAPAACHLPDGGADGRLFGITAHLYTLRHGRDQGIGDFGTLAAFADRAGAVGAATVGLNPLHALFPGDRERASPYSPSDRRFLDPIYIDLDGLPEALVVGAGDVRATAAAAAVGLRAKTHVDWSGVWAAKVTMLDAAVAAFEGLALARPADPLVAEFGAYVARAGEALERFATFEAIAAVTGSATASGFPRDLAAFDAPGVAAFAAAQVHARRRSMILQWLAERQFAAADAAGRAAGLTLGFYRDLAVGCAPDGAEAWGAGARLMHRVSVGAPPDPLAPNGQVWSLPPLNPIESARLGHAPFAELIRANMAHAGALRIDHVLGLRRLFVVPDGMRGAEGAYVDQPFEDFIGQLTLESARARCVVVGEDLGTVPWGFRERMAEAKVLSYQVVWFEREGLGFRAPQSYPALGTAVVGTHDLATLAGWWSGDDIDEDERLGRIDTDGATRQREGRVQEKRVLLDTLVAAGLLSTEDAEEVPETALTDAVAAAVHTYVARGRSMLTFVQADDLSGEVERLNLPGTDRERPNWRRRLGVGVEDLLQIPRSRAILAGLGPDRHAIVPPEPAPDVSGERAANGGGDVAPQGSIPPGTVGDRGDG